MGVCIVYLLEEFCVLGHYIIGIMIEATFFLGLKMENYESKVDRWYLEKV